MFGTHIYKIFASKEFACLVDGGFHTLTAYFGHLGSVGRQLTATLAHHHSTICYKYVMI